MIVMSVALDNLYGFKEFSVNFSYPRKIVDSPLTDEHLSDRPSFRYKRVNIIMGGNATGKTTFGKALMGIFNFIAKKDATYLINQICDRGKLAHFSLEFVAREKVLWRVETLIKSGDGSEQYKASDFRVSVKQTPIGRRDTYENCRKRLNDQKTVYGSYIELFDNIEPLGWYFTFPNDGATTDKVHLENPALFEHALNIVMKTLDPAIESVRKSRDLENSYVIKHASFETMIKEGKLIDASKTLLSTGTIHGIDISLLISAIMSHQYGWYYCDEKYSFIQSDLEQELLALMIAKLGPDEQFFFTTHNSDILDMYLPHHAYLFLKKEGEYISAVFADYYLKRNTDNLRQAVLNNRFFIKPDFSLLSQFDNT